MEDIEFEVEINLSKAHLEMIENDIKELGKDKASIKWCAIIQSRIDDCLRRIYNGSKKKTFKN